MKDFRSQESIEAAIRHNQRAGGASMDKAPALLDLSNYPAASRAFMALTTTIETIPELPHGMPHEE